MTPDRYKDTQLVEISADDVVSVNHEIADKWYVVMDRKTERALRRAERKPPGTITEIER